MSDFLTVLTLASQFVLSILPPILAIVAALCPKMGDRSWAWLAIYESRILHGDNNPIDNPRTLYLGLLGYCFKVLDVVNCTGSRFRPTDFKDAFGLDDSVPYWEVIPPKGNPGVLLLISGVLACIFSILCLLLVFRESDFPLLKDFRETLTSPGGVTLVASFGILVLTFMLPACLFSKSLFDTTALFFNGSVSKDHSDANWYAETGLVYGLAVAACAILAAKVISLLLIALFVDINTKPPPPKPAPKEGDENGKTGNPEDGEAT